MSSFVRPAILSRRVLHPHFPPHSLRRTTTSSLALTSSLGIIAEFDATSSSPFLVSVLPDGLATAVLAAAVATGLLLYRAISCNIVFPSTDVTSFVVPAAPVGTARRPPLVFVHGCAHGGFVFTGLANELARSGYESHLLTLPKSRLRSLHDYADDIGIYVRDVVGEGPVLVGHSQGAAEVAHYLLNGNVDAPVGTRAVAGIFMAPYSVEGSGPISAGLIRRYPWVMVRAAVTLNAAESIGIGDFAMMADTLFAPGAKSTTACGMEESLEAYAARLSPVESCRVFVDLSLHQLLKRDKVTPGGLGIPTLVLAAERDGIIPKESTDAMAARWGVKGLTVEGQGHCFADPGWEDAAVAPFIEWLNTNVPDVTGGDN